MTPISFRVSSLQMNDGSVVTVPSNGVLVIVGPNNVGKSVVLQEIMAEITSHRIPPKQVVQKINLDIPGDMDEFKEWLDTEARPHRSGGYLLRGQMQPFTLSDLWHKWQNGPPFHELGPDLLFYADALGRLQLANTAAAHDPTIEGPTHPMQKLLDDPELERKLFDAVYRALGVQLVLNRVRGGSVSLHLGEEPPGSWPPPKEYRRAVNALPLVEGQGDGVKSFVGIMLAVMTATYPLIIIDEPEAFLHPPQAREMGRQLASRGPEGTQIIFATHSSDVLRGVLDVSGAPVKIIRLTREDDRNYVAQLSESEVRSLWENPILRYSNAFDGLFHQGVVLCEGDADCRFYAATVDAFTEERRSPGHDLLFTHGGGTSRIPVLAHALRAAGVPTVAIVDVDILRDDSILRPLVEAFGGSFPELDADLKVVRTEVEQRGQPPTVQHVLDQLLEILKQPSPPARLTPKLSQRIRDVVRGDDGWSQVKKGGVWLRGDGYRCYQSVVGRLENLGLFLVPVGELEAWAPAISSHGPQWATEALEQNIHHDRSHAVRPFLERVVDHVSS